MIRIFLYIFFCSHFPLAHSQSRSTKQVLSTADLTNYVLSPISPRTFQLSQFLLEILPLSSVSKNFCTPRFLSATRLPTGRFLVSETADLRNRNNRRTSGHTGERYPDLESLSICLGLNYALVVRYREQHSAPR